MLLKRLGLDKTTTNAECAADGTMVAVTSRKMKIPLKRVHYEDFSDALAKQLGEKKKSKKKKKNELMPIRQEGLKKWKWQPSWPKRKKGEEEERDGDALIMKKKREGDRLSQKQYDFFCGNSQSGSEMNASKARKANRVVFHYS